MFLFDNVRECTLQVSSSSIPSNSGSPALEPVRLSGHEGLNSLFAYELLLKTPDALNLGASGASDFDLDSFIGREITCSIQLDGAGQFLPGAVGASNNHIGAGVRQISALITDAAMWGEEGRHIQYKLTLRPWLHLATLTTDCKIFQNKTVVDIFDELLSGYDFAVDKRLIETYPTRDYQTQYNESDFEFFSRLCQEWGISYFFEHGEDKHRLVLIDNMGAYKKNASAAYHEVEYHAPGWKVDAEFVHSFVPHHQLTSGKYATRDYDYTRPRADLGVGRNDPRPTGQANGEVYQWQAGAAGSHYAQPRAGMAEANDPQGEGRQLALLRMQALRTHGARAQASGNLRGMVPGCSFMLSKHPRQKANAEYLILDARLLIEDVAQDSQIKGAASDRRQDWKVEVDFTAHPMAESLRPASTLAKPFTHGPQSALVVGPEGQNLWTDELGRIKVQFPWDRIGQKNQHSTCWIRVSSPWAGNQLGGVQVPRIGQEVIVDFFGGDPDLPVCTGRLGLAAVAWTCVAIFWRIFLRAAFFTAITARYRFNRTTGKVYVLRPKKFGGNAVLDWHRVQAHPAWCTPLEVKPGWQYHQTERDKRKRAGGGFSMRRGLVLYWPPLDANDPERKGEDILWIGKWLSGTPLWEYIRTFMQEGMGAVPAPEPHEYRRKRRSSMWQYLWEEGFDTTIREARLLGNEKPERAVGVGDWLREGPFVIFNSWAQWLCWWPTFPKEWNSDCGQKRRERGIGVEEPLRWKAKA